MPKPTQINQSSQLLSAAALSHDFTVGSARNAERNVELLGVYIKADGNISQTVTVSLISQGVAARTYQLDTASLSSSSIYRFRPSPSEKLVRGDVIRVACTNSGTPAVTVYSEVRYRESD